MRDCHDKLFRHVFGRPNHAAKLLRAVLPPAVVEHVDLSCLALEKTSYIDHKLAESRTDIVYRTPVAGEDARIYLIIEHQSRPQRLMPYRFLRYMVGIWNEYLRDEPDATTLPPILPVLLYQGGPRGPRCAWRAPLRMSEIVRLAPPARDVLEPHCPQLEVVLVDLGVMDDASLRERGIGPVPTLCLWALARVRYSRDVVADVRSVMDLIGAIQRSPDGLQELAVILRYILEVTDARDPDTARKVAEMITPHNEHEPRSSILDIIDRRAREENHKMGLEEGRKMGLEEGRKMGLEEGREEGEQLGREEGRHAGQRELVCKLLEQRFGELPPPVQHRLDEAGLEELGQIALRVLSAATLDEALAGLC